MLRISKNPSQSRGNDSLRTIVFLGGDSHTQGGQEGWTASGMQRRGKARSKVQIFELRHMKKSRFLWISNVGVNWWVCGWAICRPCQTFHVLTCGRFRLALHVFGVLDSQIRMASTWLNAWPCGECDLLGSLSIKAWSLKMCIYMYVWYVCINLYVCRLCNIYIYIHICICVYLYM